MIVPNSVDKDRILLRLDTFQFVAEANAELLEKNPSLKEQFDLSVQKVLDYLKELDAYEESGNEIHYQSILASAELGLERVHYLIKQILE